MIDAATILSYFASLNHNLSKKLNIVNLRGSLKLNDFYGFKKKS